MANISTIKVGSTSYGITPASHASTATTYGAATASNYGHVKLSDNYTSSAGAAASGIGASSAAVYNAYNTLNSNLPVWQCWHNNNDALTASIPSGHIGMLFVKTEGLTFCGLYMIYTIYVGYVQPLVFTIYRSHEIEPSDIFTLSATSNYEVTVTPKTKNGVMSGWFIVK